MSSFIQSFTTVGAEVAKLFSLAFFGFIFTHFEIISEKGLNDISKLLLYLILPCLIFSSFLTKFETAKLPNWWIWVLAGASLRLVTLFFGYIVSSRFFQKEKKQLTCMIGLQNSAYLPLALAAALLPTGEQGLAFILIFLIGMGGSPILWSIGVNLLSEAGGWSIRKTISPPLVITALSIALVMVGWSQFIPQLVVETASFAGDITIPLVMIVLGGILGRMDFANRTNWSGISLLILVKLLIFPLLALSIIYLLKLPRTIGFILLIQASTPPATNLIVMGRHYGGKLDFLNQGILYSYLTATVTIPLMISLFYLLGNI